MCAPSDTGSLSQKGRVLTGNKDADIIIENARNLPSAGEMATHFYRMHRSFDAFQRNTDLRASPGCIGDRPLTLTPQSNPTQASTSTIDVKHVDKSLGNAHDD